VKSKARITSEVKFQTSFRHSRVIIPRILGIPGIFLSHISSWFVFWPKFLYSCFEWLKVHCQGTHYYYTPCLVFWNIKVLLSKNSPQFLLHLLILLFWCSKSQMGFWKWKLAWKINFSLCRVICEKIFYHAKMRS